MVRFYFPACSASPPYRCSECVSCVINHRNAILFTQPLEAVDVAAVAIDMHGDDGFGARGDEFLDFCRVEAEGFGIDIRKDRGRADALEGVGGGDEGEGSGDDIAAGESHRVVAEFEGESAVVEEREVGFGYAEVGGECRLELLQHRAVVREPLVVPHFVDAGFEFFQVRKVRTSDEDGLREFSHCLSLRLFEFVHGFHGLHGLKLKS